MIRVYILLFQQFVYCSDCECEVEPWGEWELVGTCGYTQKFCSRICTKNNGWTLGLTCDEDTKDTKKEYKMNPLPPCRKYRSKIDYIFIKIDMYMICCIVYATYLVR